jgi:dipeptidyl aminopeptidase/acylaminoacyl peptidase
MNSNSAQLPLIPREVLFGNPEKITPRISPDGKHIAYLAPYEGVINIWVRSVDKDDARPLTREQVPILTPLLPEGFHWAPNNEQIVYSKDRDGDENYRVYVIPLAGGDPVELTPFDGVQAQVYAPEPDFPDEMLVGLNNRDPQLHDLHRINLKTGERRLEAENTIGAIELRPDHRLRARAAQCITPDGGLLFKHRPGTGDSWEDLFRCGAEDSWTTQAVGFSRDNETLYIHSSVGTNTTELRAYNLRTKEERVLARHPEADVTDELIHPRTHEVQAAAFSKERQEWLVLDPSIKEDFEALGKLHHGDFTVVSRDYDDKIWLVAYEQDKGPIVYYSYERETRKGTFLFSNRPALEGLALAEMKPISYQARDGLTIHGYLTTPVGEAPRNLPTVINVHGGPWWRDEWGYRPDVQWLTNRGYACLQINFRGSTGYGKAFLNAANREWAGKMQDDITDGVKWLIEQGVADPKRVAIFGGSYGGYATLCGLTTTPDLYACGVDMVGPSNLITWMENIPPYWETWRPLIYERVGNPETEPDFLRSRSPLFMIDRIKAPLFIAQGANDPRVPRVESIQIRDALQKAGKTVEYLEFEDEGHGLIRPENRLRFFAAAEKFLADHIGGRFEA